MLDHVVGAAKKNWQTAAWFLERVFPDEFALRMANRTHVTGEATEKVKLIDLERLKQIHKIAAEVEQAKSRFTLSQSPAFFAECLRIRQSVQLNRRGAAS
jgi:hypothetical protein